jgi:hypothetical protein
MAFECLQIRTATHLKESKMKFGWVGLVMTLLIFGASTSGAQEQSDAPLET